MIVDLINRIFGAGHAVAQGAPPELAAIGVEFHDRRKFAAQSHHGYKTRSRDIRKVGGVCLHQTACVMGERPERYDGGGAHVFVTRRGKVIWLHDFDRMVVAANGLNWTTVSIEFDGLLFGIEGDDSTVWDNPATSARETGMPLTPEQAVAGRAVIRWVKAEVERRGGRFLWIRAHREASASRRSDPGQAVWRDVALPAAKELKLGAGSFPVGDGRHIPREWDPTSGNRY